MFYEPLSENNNQKEKKDNNKIIKTKYCLLKWNMYVYV
jgi:hypothetical protein